MYEFVLYNLYKNCMNLYEIVQKPTNSYVSICIQFVRYKLVCTNCVVRIRMKKKWNKNSHGIPTHAPITSEPTYYQLAVLLTESLSYFIIYDHIEILYKKTYQKMRLYKFIGVLYSHPLRCNWTNTFCLSWHDRKMIGHDCRAEFLPPKSALRNYSRLKVPCEIIF